MQGTTFQTERHSPSPNIPVPLGILLGARTEAREDSLDLGRERWEAGAASEATLPPPSSGDNPGKELGPKGCVLGKAPARIPLHTNFPKLDIPAGLCHPHLGLPTLSHQNCTKPGMGSREVESQRKNNIKACSCAARIFRYQEVKTGRGSIPPTGVLGRWESHTEHGVTR